MIKKDLATRLAEKQNITIFEAQAIVDDLLSILKKTIEKGEEIELRGFGNFRIRQQGSRPGRNPKTGDEVIIPARKRVFFKPSKQLKIEG